MSSTMFLSLSYYNVPREVRKLLTLALLKEAKRIQKAPMILIDSEPNTMMKTIPGKLVKEHPLYRFVSTFLKDLDIPFLSREDFQVFCNELGRLKNQNPFDGSMVVVLQKRPPSDPSVALFQSICVVTPRDTSVIPILYQTINSIRTYNGMIPITLWVYDEPNIEKGAEFFLQIKQELEQLSKDDLELSYLGSIRVPPEEIILLTRFDADLHTLYPQSPFLGAVRYAAERLFNFPEVPAMVLESRILKNIIQD